MKWFDWLSTHLRSIRLGARSSSSKAVIRREPVAAPSPRAVAAPERIAFPSPIVGMPHPDQPGVDSIPAREAKLLETIERRVLAGDFELPQLPSTTIAVVELASDPDAAAVRVASLVERDPVLSSELLKIANSALLATSSPARTLQQAIVRLGGRQLRGLAFALQMKRVVSRAKGLTSYADSFWRQATSMAKLARIVAPSAHIDPEQAFLVGLLHDIGKVPLLDLLGREVASRFEITRALVGRVFANFHEIVGDKLAERWNLPGDLRSVAACHHGYVNNATAPESAALASLVHVLDMQLALGDEVSYYELRQRAEFDALQIAPEARGSVLHACVSAFAGETRELDNGPTAGSTRSHVHQSRLLN